MREMGLELRYEGNVMHPMVLLMRHLTSIFSFWIVSRACADSLYSADRQLVKPVVYER